MATVRSAEFSQFQSAPKASVSVWLQSVSDRRTPADGVDHELASVTVYLRCDSVKECPPEVTNGQASPIVMECEERTSKGTETKHGQSSVPFLILKRI